MKCSKCNGEIGEGAKFCAACGTAAGEPEGDQMAKSMCGACSHELPDGAQFCPACGEILAKSAGAEYEEVLDVLETLAKANSALTDDIEIPEIDVDELPDDFGEDRNTLAKSMSVEDGEEVVDAFPILSALFGAHNGIINGQTALGQETRALRKEVGILAKSLVTVMRGQRDINGLIEQIGNLPRGRKSAAHRVEVMAKGGPGATPETPTNDRRQNAEIIAKCLKAQGDVFTAQDIVMLNEFVNGGMSPAKIVASGSELGAKIRQVCPELAN